MSPPYTPALHDGSTADWGDGAPSPSIPTSDFITLAGVAIESPEDLAVSIYLGWSKADGRIYSVIERIDDAYINEYDGTTSDMWRHDNVEIMLAGDHSGGRYDGLSLDAFGEDEVKRLRDAQAQV